MNKKTDGNELTLYQKLIHIISSFCFVNKGKPIGVNENYEIFQKLYNDSHLNSKIINEKEFLKNCLFIINEFDNLSKDEKDINKIKADIISVLYSNQKNKK